MKALPIIMSGPMVRALLEGRKTETRRLPTSMWANAKLHFFEGDRVYLYVRETLAYDWGRERWTYRADGAMVMPGRTSVLPRPTPTNLPTGVITSIHMAKCLSRLTLELTYAVTEPLQAITEQSAQAEGVGPYDDEGGVTGTSYRLAYRDLWNQLHTKPGTTWADNPSVVALTFRVHRANVQDVMRRAAA